MLPKVSVHIHIQSLSLITIIFQPNCPSIQNPGNLVAGGVKEQAEQCFENIKAIVESIDHVMSDVVRITVFVKNIKDVDAVDEVYKSYLPNLCTHPDNRCGCSIAYGCIGANRSTDFKR